MTASAAPPARRGRRGRLRRLVAVGVVVGACAGPGAPLRTIFTELDTADVADRLRAIGARSFGTLLRAQSEGDRLRSHREVEAAGAEFRLTFLPPGFRTPQASAFDRASVTALFEAGGDDARDGIAWLDLPSPSGGAAATRAAPGRMDAVVSSVGSR